MSRCLQGQLPNSNAFGELEEGAPSRQIQQVLLAGAMYSEILNEYFTMKMIVEFSSNDLTFKKKT